MDKKQEWVFCYWDEPIINKPKEDKDEKRKDYPSREKDSNKT